MSKLEDKIRDFQMRESVNIQQIQQQRKDIQTKDIQLQEKDRLLQEKESQFQQELASRERQVYLLDHKLEEQEKATAEVQEMNRSLQRQIEQLQERLSQLNIAPSQRPPLVQHPAEVMKRELRGEHVYTSLIKSPPPAQQQASPHKPHLPPRPSTKRKQQESPRAHHEPRPPPRPPIKQTVAQQQASPPTRHKPHPPTRQKVVLKWRDGGRAPLTMERGGAVGDENMAYFLSIRGEACCYNVITKKWYELPNCPYSYSSLAIVHGLITAIGGCTSDKFIPLDKLLCLMSNGEWMEHLPPMPTKRWKTAAVATKQHLIVAGGKKETASQLDTVEVMDVQSIQWSTVASLPHPYTEASATICGDDLYMLGGFDDNGKSKSVLTCSLTELLLSKKKVPSVAVWHRVADVPTTRSTCAAVNGQLLAVGGLDAGNKKTDAVYAYSSATNSWDLINNMPTAQYDRLVVVLPTNEMIVVGGCTTFKVDKVDIASIL